MVDIDSAAGIVALVRKKEGMVDLRLRGEVGCLGSHCARGRCQMAVYTTAVVARLMDLSSPWVLAVVESKLEGLEVEGEDEEAHMNVMGLSLVCDLDGRIANALKDDGPIDLEVRADVRRENDEEDN